MRNEKFMIASIVALAVWALPAITAGQEFKVVVNANNPASTISKQNLSKCFLKQTNTWINGTPVIPVDLAVGSDTRKAFSQEIHHRDVSAVKSYWQRQIFSGRGVPPTEKASDQEVLAFVRMNDGAIGYVATSTDLGTGVKVLTITDQ